LEATSLPRHPLARLRRRPLARLLRHPLLQPELEDLARRRNLQPEALVLRAVDSALSKRGVLERNPQVDLEPQQVDSGPQQLEDLAQRRNLQPEALVLRPVDLVARQQQVLSERNPRVGLEPQLEDLARRRNLQPEALVLRRVRHRPLHLVKLQTLLLEAERLPRVLAVQLHHRLVTPPVDSGVDKQRQHLALLRLLPRVRLVRAQDLGLALHLVALGVAQHQRLVRSIPVAVPPSGR
jgi:hypothetical protein